MKSRRQSFLAWCAEREFRPGRFALVVLITWALAGSDALFKGRLTNYSYDKLTSSRRGAGPTSVAIIYMNQQTLVELGTHPDGTLSRTNYARLLDKLAQAKPNVVVLDLILSRTNVVAGEDDMLAKALTNHGNVILSSAMDFGAVGVAPIFSLTPPTLQLRHAARGWGHAGLHPDPDKVVRVISRDNESARYIGTLARDSFTQTKSVQGASLGLNYYGAPQDKPFIAYPLETVLATTWDDGVTFSNKIVFVGAKWEAGAPGQLMDTFMTPYSQEAAGVEIHATAVANLLNNEGLRWLPFWPIALLWGLVLAFVVSLPTRMVAAVLAAVAALGLFALAFLLHWKANLFLPWGVCALVQVPGALLARWWLNPKLKVVAFISYRREDSAYVQLILDRLEARGYSAFVDRELGPGLFWSQIEEKIRKLPAFILIITDRTFPFRAGEDIFRNEILVALDAKKKIVPVRAVPGKLADILPPEIASITRYQDVEYNHRNVPGSVKDAIKAIFTAVESPTAPGSTRPVRSQPTP